MFLRLIMGLPDCFGGYLDGIAKIKIISTPLWNMMIVNTATRRSSPGDGMYSVGYGVDGVVWEYGARDFLVTHGDAINIS